MSGSDSEQTNGAWRQLGVRLAVFFLPIVLAWTALEWWATGVPNTYSAKRQRLESLTNEVATLIVGSSTAFNGIKPSLLSGSAFNLATPGETFYESDQLVMRVLPSLPKLKRVLIQIEYPTLFRFEDTLEPWRQYCYEQEWSVPPRCLKDRVDCRMLSRLALRTPRYYLDLLIGAATKWIRTGKFELDQNDLPLMDDRGWGPAGQLASAQMDVLSPANANL